MKYLEYQLKKQIAKFLLYHAVDHFIFSYDQMGLRPAQKARHKAISGKGGFPDLFIPIPRKEYKGFFLETKKETPYKKNGELKKNDHLREQADYLEWLRNQGYYADFCWSLENFEYHFNNYFYDHDSNGFEKTKEDLAH